MFFKRYVEGKGAFFGGGVVIHSVNIFPINMKACYLIYRTNFY